MPQASKIPAAVDKEWEKWSKFRRGTWQKSEAKRGDRWSKDVGRESSFCIINGHLSSEKFWIGGKAPKIQRSSLYSETPHERRFGEPFKGPMIPSGALIEYHPISPKDKARILILARENNQESDLAMSWSRVILQRRYSDSRSEDLEKVGYSSSTTQREGDSNWTKDDECKFPVADGTAKLRGRDYEFRESILRRESESPF